MVVPSNGGGCTPFIAALRSDEAPPFTAPQRVAGAVGGVKPWPAWKIQPCPDTVRAISFREICGYNFSQPTQHKKNGTKQGFGGFRCDLDVLKCVFHHYFGPCDLY